MVHSSPTRMPGTVARMTRPVTSVTRPDSRRGDAASSRDSASETSRRDGARCGPLRPGERIFQRGELATQAGIDVPESGLDDAAVASDVFVLHDGEPRGH